MITINNLKNNPSNSVTAYHGTNFNIEKFSHFSKEFSNDQYGPGIYFTNDEETAAKYGNNIYKVKLNTKNFITETTKLNLSKVTSIINNNLTESNLSNWDENETIAKKLLIKNTIDYSSYYKTLLNIWSEVFNLKNPPYLKAMLEYGIDGVIIKINKKLTYYVVYNTKVIT